MPTPKPLAMNALVADHTQQKARLDDLLGAFRQVLPAEAQAPTDSNSRNNKLLDSILRDQAFLTKQATAVQQLVTMFEDLPAFTLTDDVTAPARELLGLLDQLLVSMRRNYVFLSRRFQQRKLEKSPLTAYHQAAEDLREAGQDLEAIFFVFPQDAEFQATTEELRRIAAGGE